MLTLNMANLTDLEESMHETLLTLLQSDKDMRVVDAAQACGVSNSKVSKFVRKIGFKNFKEFKLYYSGEKIERFYSSELERIALFLEELNQVNVRLFADTISKYEKVILYGLGPSYIAAQYFCYKLSIVTGANISYTQSEDFIHQVSDADTLLIVLSVTGKFSTFDDLFEKVKENKGKTLLLLEEYVNDYQYNVDYLFQLTNKVQDPNLLAFEKTRTLFFIFIEEVISELYKIKQLDK